MKGGCRFGGRARSGPWREGPFRRGRKRQRFGLRRRHQRDLRHAMFFWLMGVVVTMVIAVPLLIWLLAPGVHDRADRASFQAFWAARFADVWDDPAERGKLAAAAAQAFQVHVRLRDPRGHTLETHGPRCAGFKESTPIARGGQALGAVEVCLAPPAGHERVILALFAMVGLLWVASGRIARRLSRPLSELARVARRVGTGDLQARSGLQRHRLQEVRDLALTIDDMAGRVQKQLDDQRELLAAVSHELRSPLSRMRIALEIARERGVDEDLLTRLQEEIISSDKLVGDMLASARLDFQGLTKQAFTPEPLVDNALQRRGLGGVQVSLQGAANIELFGDPALVARAFHNLLDNAERHGGGVDRVVLRRDADQLWIQVEDRGPGFDPAALPHVFESFYRKAQGGVQGLGLGLALVDRIAVAHGGGTRAQNRSDGGAAVGFWLPVPSSSHVSSG